MKENQVIPFYNYQHSVCVTQKQDERDSEGKIWKLAVEANIREPHGLIYVINKIKPGKKKILKNRNIEFK